jgi:hypothetical protein
MIDIASSKSFRSNYKDWNSRRMIYSNFNILIHKIEHIVRIGIAVNYHQQTIFYIHCNDPMIIPLSRNLFKTLLQ